MSPVIQLSTADKVLLHLSRIRFDKDSEVVPKGICQEGIAEAVGMLRSHVPRTVKDLWGQGLVEEQKRRVRDGDKRIKVYFLTQKGMAQAGRIEQDAMARVVPVKVQNTLVQGMTLSQIENAFHRRIDLLRMGGEDDYLDLDTMATRGVTDFTDSPKTHEFLDREDSLEQLKRFLKSRSMMLAVYGAKGIGTTTLVKRFIEMLDEWNILWVSLGRHQTAERIQGRIAEFTKGFGSKADAVMSTSAGNNVLMVFDGYYDVEEGVVEYFRSMLDRSAGAKIIVTCRDSTPSYNRFYGKAHIDAVIVQEMTIRGLPPKEARELLGNPDIPDEAFKRIYAMSRGSPMILAMLKTRDEQGLRKNTTFTNEEIRFLLVEAAATVK